MKGRGRAVAVLVGLAATLAEGRARADGPHRQVAVLEYRAGTSGARNLGERLAVTLREATSLRVTEPAEARRRLGGHADALVARCAGDARCVAEIGRRLGVDEVVLVGLSQLGDLIVALQRIRVPSGEIQGRVAESIAPGSEPDQTALGDLLRRLLPPEDFVRYGAIRVRTPIAGARVLLDGQPAGETPVGELKVQAPRRVLLQVEKPGLVPFSARLEVLPDSVTEVAPELPLLGGAVPWYKKWWVWAIVGGAAAGAATAVAVTRGGSSTADLVIRPPQ